MTDVLLPGDPPIRLKLRRSARARRYALRVPATGGDAVLTVPGRAALEEGLQFAQSRRDWLLRQIHKQPDILYAVPGASIPIDGHPVEIVPGKGRSPTLFEGKLHVPGPAQRIPAKVAGFLKTLARAQLADACDSYAQKLGRDYTRLDLRDTHGRWGSCSSNGRLMFSWRLIMAPKAVRNYVVAHEVAHLAHMNHGPKFWATVEQLYPGHTAQRLWLRQQGATLHRYRFTPPEDEGPNLDHRHNSD